ncbi:MAG: DUF4326 domain-containing protein, partial [Chloroflexota bacterium]|nr:DUF4326 domain-containing protein [Chloroflexota bacterium]
MTGRAGHVRDDDPGAVYVDRRQHWLGLKASPFANPYRIGKDGTRAEVIEQYRERLLASPALLARLPKLRGKPPARWCRHDGEERTADNACDTDVLIELRHRFTDAEMGAMGA